MVTRSPLGLPLSETAPIWLGRDPGCVLREAYSTAVPRAGIQTSGECLLAPCDVLLTCAAEFCLPAQLGAPLPLSFVSSTSYIGSGT